MAGASVANPGGFSYAQAAKGRAAAAKSQTPSSKVASGTATPATEMLSELGPSSSNWADDVELTVGDKSVESPKVLEDSNEQVEAKSSAIERAKTEDKVQSSPSGVSSPDLTVSAELHDDSSSAQNGSSQTSWDVKSQTSEPSQPSQPTEPSWIAARNARQSEKERHGSAQHTEGKGKKKAEEPAPKPPVELQPAAPPHVNPWAKRAEENKARMAAYQQTAKPAPAKPAAGSANNKENQRPKQDARKKNASTNGATRDADRPVSAGGDAKKPAGSQAKPAQNNNKAEVQGPSTTPAGNARRDTVAPFPSKQPQGERQSIQVPSVAPPPVKDETSWPTPDTVQEIERKAAAAEKEAEEDKDEDKAAAGKPRKKTEWTTVPVVPNIIWETQNIRDPRRAPPTERRGGGAVRGRGGYRGGPNGVANGERTSTRVNGTHGDDESAAVQRSSSPSSNAERNTQVNNASDLNKTAPMQLSDLAKEHSLIEAANFTAAPKFDAPSKNDVSTATDGHVDGKMPSPIPRRTSVGTQTEGNAGNVETPARDTAPTKPTEGRKEGRNGEYRDATFRNSKRGGRGRGGARDAVNGHGAHPFSNGHSAEFGASPGFGVPQSPTTFNAPRGGHQNHYQNGRGNWRGGNGRTQSIPMEGYYNNNNRFAGPYQGAHPQLHPVQTFGPAMYGYGEYPMTAMPYPGYMDHSYLMSLVGMQLEYYFSIDNLLKDMYLRKNMDSQGFVALEVIASFNRIKQLSTDMELLKLVCLNSNTVEICMGEDGKERLRRVKEWNKWVLPMEDRFAAARNDGPSNIERPERPIPASYGPPPMHMRGPASAYPNMPQRFGNGRSFDQGFAMNGMNPQSAFFDGGFQDMSNGDEMRGRTATSPLRENGFTPAHNSLAEAAGSTNPDGEGDTFPDQNIEQLTVCVKMSNRRISHHSAASRTFSDGSLDRNMTHEGDKPSDGEAQSLTNGESLPNGTDSSRQTSPNSTTSPDRAANGQEVSVFWIKDNDTPVGTLPTGLTPEPYVHLRLKAFEQREHAATGTCPYDLDVLYQFWSHFLIRNFNNRMYTEFQHYATADAKERQNFTGQENLVKYYSQALSSNNAIPARVLQDYVEFVKAENKQDGTAFKQLRAAWRNGALNLRNRKKLTDLVDQPLKEQLEG